MIGYVEINLKKLVRKSMDSLLLLLESANVDHILSCQPVTQMYLQQSNAWSAIDHATACDDL